MLLCLLLLFTWISNSQQGNYLTFIFMKCYSIGELKKIGHRNIKFDSILISLSWFLVVELYQCLCYGGQSFLIPL